MTEKSAERYTVKIVFRGLFLAVRRADGIAVVLPDASSPGAALLGAETDLLRTLLASLQPFREHTAAIEFPLADWDNRSTLMPRLVHVHKGTKEPVALFFLPKAEVAFGGLHQGASEVPSQLQVERKLYTPLTDDLLLLASHPEHGFDQLPRFDSAVDEAAVEKHFAAKLFLRFGEVYTERRSMRGTEVRQWRQVSVLNKDYLGDDDRTRLGLPASPPVTEVRPINLDLVVRFTLPMTNPLHILVSAENSLPTRFILRPSDPRRELRVWVKNRELEAILQDSDLVPDPYPAMGVDGDATDRDHAMFLRLAQDPASLTVPRDDSDDASDTLGGCGGKGG